MFFYALVSLALVLALFFLSRRLYNQIFLFFFQFIKHKNTSIKLLVISLLPGTIIHELSHFLAATFLGVRTGTINLMPKIRDNGEIVAGETQIAKCDPIRFSIIGIAPFILGLGIIYSISRFYLFESVDFEGIIFPLLGELSSIMTSFDIFVLLIVFLIFFWISNSMFSSKKDLSAIIIPLVLLYIFAFILYFSGFKLELSHQILGSLNLFFHQLSFYLFFVFGFNILIFLTLNLINRLFSARHK